MKSSFRDCLFKSKSLKNIDEGRTFDTPEIFGVFPEIPLSKTNWSIPESTLHTPVRNVSSSSTL